MKLSCPLDGCHSNAAMMGTHPIADGLLAIVMLVFLVYVAVCLTRGPS